MHDLYNLADMLCDELCEYGRNGDLSLSSLQTIDMLAHACKNVYKIIKHKEADGGSTRKMWSKNGAEMARKLREMMCDTSDDTMRYELRRLADKVESM